VHVETSSRFHSESTWNVETDLTWKDYSSVVKKRIPSGFERKTTTDDKLWFVKSLPGDALTVEIEQASPGPPLRVRVRFRAAPD